MSEPTLPTTAITEREPFDFKDRYGAQATGGAILIGLGLCVAAGGLFYDPTVSSFGDSVVNMGRAIDKVMIFAGGIGMTLAGMILRATAMILDWVREGTMRHRFEMGR
jgi:hypothetical protein